MQSERLLTRPLAVFLAVVAAVLVVAGSRALATPGLAGALRQLRDQDCEQDERVGLLQQVLQAGLDSSDPADRLPAAMAAVALEQRASYDLCLRVLGAELPVKSDDEARLDLAGLGEPVLRNLLAAMLLDSRGDVAAAREAYRRVLRQCPHWGMQLAAQIAAARLQRLG